MQIEDYFTEEDAKFFFSRQQASDFAKLIAGDFNPIHDQDARRFCVPGDLLFAVVLYKYGLSRHMRFIFSGMVTEETVLIFPDVAAQTLIIKDAGGREYLRVEREGETSRDLDLIQDLTRGYVEFSGQTFPHILVPLMSDHHIMINPERPLVIYESMVIDISRLDISDLQLELTQSSLDIDGKRGDVRLAFRLSAAGKTVGTGEKNMVLSGLRPFDTAKVDELVESYTARKQAYNVAKR